MKVYVVLDGFEFKGVFGNKLDAYKHALEIKTDKSDIKVIEPEINVTPNYTIKSNK